MSLVDQAQLYGSIGPYPLSVRRVPYHIIAILLSDGGAMRYPMTCMTAEDWGSWMQSDSEINTGFQHGDLRCIPELQTPTESLAWKRDHDRGGELITSHATSMT